MKQKRYHVILDITHVSPKKLTDAVGLKKFLSQLPGVIDMKVLKGPFVAIGVPENPGITGFVIIDYSHISIHTFSAYGEALVDIFSCKQYKKSDAVEKTLKYFRVKKSSVKLRTVSWG